MSSSGVVQGKPDTDTETTQHGTEQDLLDFYSRRLAPELHRRNHASYLKRNALAFPCASQGLHCSQPWLVYWTIQAADVLGLMGELFAIAPPKALADRVLGCYVVEGTVETATVDHESSDKTKSKKVEKFGGFGGGQGQLPHLAASYAAIMSLAIISQRYPEVVDLLMRGEEMGKDGKDVSSPSSSSSIRREISNWMNTLFIPSTATSSSTTTSTAVAPALPTVSSVMEGSFRMHTGGESDIRASFTVAAITSLLQFPTSWTASYINPTSVGFVNRCFTFEGGVACSPLSPEAHGGYVSLGLTALVLWEEHRNQTPPSSFDTSNTTSSCGTTTITMLSSSSCPSLHNLGRWIAARQCTWEGGFNGRTNKLVDSCYSFWVGAAVVLYEGLRSQQNLLSANTNTTPASSSSSSSLLSPPSNYNIIDELRLEYLALPTLHSTSSSSSTTPSNTCSKAVLEAGAEISVAEMMLTDDFLSGLISSPPSTVASESSSLSPPISSTSVVRDVCEPIRESCGGGGAAVSAEKEEEDNDTRDAIAFQPPHGDPWGFHTLANQRRLQEYVFKFCQNSQRGGLMDKPYCPNDSYHTCYSLSGTSCMQEGYIRERQTQSLSQFSTRGNDGTLTKAAVDELLEGWDGAGAGWGTLLPRTDWEAATLKKSNPPSTSTSTTTDSLFDDDLGVLYTTNPLYNVRPQHVARFHSAAPSATGIPHQKV